MLQSVLLLLGSDNTFSPRTLAFKGDVAAGVEQVFGTSTPRMVAKVE
jgi:hypothetical protein